MHDVTQFKAIFDHIVMLLIIEVTTKYLTPFPVTVFMDDPLVHWMIWKKNATHPSLLSVN